MKKLLTILVIAASAVSAPAFQRNVLIQTHPKLPAREILERLDLKMAWAAKVQTDGLRDGFFSVQLIPGKNFTLLVAQTFQGSVLAINADTGDILWRTTVDLPYRPMMPVGYNDQAIFVVRNMTLYVLNRDDGTHLVYSIDPATNQPDYGQQAGDVAPTAAPAADDAAGSLSASAARYARYAVPNFRAAIKQQKSSAKLEPSPEVIRQWDFPVPGYLSQPPVLTAATEALVTDEGSVAVIKKSMPAEDGPDLLWQFQTEGAVPAPVASYKSMIYIPSQDFFVHAYDAAMGRITWRFAAQAPVNRSPVATDADLFVSVSKKGLQRLDRLDGRSKWASAETAKFLATNQPLCLRGWIKFGNMQVLDYNRGKVLAAWDTRDWIVPVPNDLTDRIYLANHDGQIICLRHRDLVKPLPVRTFDDVRPKAKDIKKKGRRDSAAAPGNDGKGLDKELRDELGAAPAVTGAFGGERQFFSAQRPALRMDPSAGCVNQSGTGESN